MPLPSLLVCCQGAAAEQGVPGCQAGSSWRRGDGWKGPCDQSSCWAPLPPTLPPADRRALEKIGKQSYQIELCEAAGKLARQAVVESGRGDVLVAGGWRLLAMCCQPHMGTSSGQPFPPLSN